VPPSNQRDPGALRGGGEGTSAGENRATGRRTDGERSIHQTALRERGERGLASWGKAGTVGQTEKKRDPIGKKELKNGLGPPVGSGKNAEDQC